MSVYIKGMEMPSEQYGKMVITLYPNGHVAEYVGDIGRVWEAIPVPKHGDLIDRDALKAKQQEDADLFIGSPVDIERRDEALNAVANIVNAPTIIPADPAEEGEG